MEDQIDYDSSDMDCTPPTILEAAKATTLELLPIKSRKRYELANSQFEDWRKKNNVKSSYSENVLMAYFGELSAKVSPNTLWTQYSMLKSTLSIHQNINISQYIKLRAFLKRKNDGYLPKKSKVLSSQEIQTFLNDAPNNKFLLHKVNFFFKYKLFIYSDYFGIVHRLYLLLESVALVAKWNLLNYRLMI